MGLLIAAGQFLSQICRYANSLKLKYKLGVVPNKPVATVDSTKDLR